MDLELYQENVLDHYKNPLNKGKLVDFNSHYRDLNPLCGDEITIYVNVVEGIVKDVSFEGKGCAISQAAASMLTEEVKGMGIEDVKKLGKEDIFSLLGIPISYTREKCALLALKVIQKC